MTTLSMQRDFFTSKWRWLWPVAIAGSIFAASGRSQLAGPDIEVPNLDKFVHFAVFGLLATSIVRLGRGWRAALFAVLLTSGYGIFDEWRQSFTPGRFVEVADWVADTLGAMVAVILYRCWPFYRSLLETPVKRKRRVENPAPVESVSGP